MEKWHGASVRVKKMELQEITELLGGKAEVVAKGTEIFGGSEKFLVWMNQPCAALSNNTPFSMLGSRFGIETIFDELGRIEHGVYS